MKAKYYLPLLGAVLLFAGCDDQIMEWGRPNGEQAVTSADIPLAVKEVLANYPNIKDVAAQYKPNLVVGLGCSAAYYAEDPEHTVKNATVGYRTLANDNYQMITCGNAMKMDAVVTNSGGLNFANIDAFLDQMPEGMKLYGHNFIWYQQQNQTYLKSLIAPTMIIKTEGDIANILPGDASDFNGGTSGGWGSWGSNKKSGGVVDGVGTDGTPAMVLENKGDGNYWEAQMAYTFDQPLEKDKEYTIRFKAKCSNGAGKLQFQYQNGTTYGSQGGYNEFSVGTDWTTCEYTFTITKYDDVNRILINFGKVGGTYTIDDIQFGEKQKDKMDNVLAGDASDFEGGTTGGWGSWGSNKESAAVEDGAGHNGKGLVLKAKADGNFWEAQCAYTFDQPLDNTKKYIIQFWAKSTSAAGQLQFQYQNGSTYGSQGAYTTFDVGQQWVQCEASFTPGYDDVNRIILNFGKVGATYYIDDIKFGIAKDQGSSTGAKQMIMARAGKRHATSITYKLKTAEEKREALLTAMDGWIKGMADHLKEKGVAPYGYDVINEPISDGSNKVRGVDNVFGGSTTDDDGNVTYDEAPTESETDGLSLNWGNNRFYWGYYVPDFAVQAFQKARKYLPAETKLFVNDYNLEISPEKLNALVKFVQDIDAANGSPIVDGIGSQVHFDLSAATDDWDADVALIAKLREKVDAMFKALAASGKLIRVTELDVAMGTSSPSAAQYRTQAETYKMIFESYFQNVPEAQQSGITIWSLSDNADEHEYWLKGDLPNVFDGQYLRKWAYKGVCDGIAGEDLGLKFGGDDYKAYYEKNNVSPSVSE